MALSASLQLRQNQSLVMTPQLMQSIRLLQFTHIELMQFVELEVEKNPLLERSDETVDGSLPDHKQSSQISNEGDGPPNPPGPQQETGQDDWFRTELDRHGQETSAGLDAAPEDVFPEDSGAPQPDTPELADNWKSMPGSSSVSADGFLDVDGFAARPQTLRDHVGEQIALAFIDPVERLIALDIADHLDAAGYVQVNLSEHAERLNIELAIVEKTLDCLQDLEPAGLFARSLAECLAIQLRRKNRLDPAMQALVANLDLLARRDFKSLKKICGVEEEDLLDMLSEIQALDPKPGNRFDNAFVQTIVPDVFVRAAPGGGWSAELNAETLPRVLVDEAYFIQISNSVGQKNEDREFLNECMRNANWLTRSLDQRAKTILKVTSEIILQQSEFLLHGVESLRPLTLKTVADAIKMHESTVSRVTSNKYMATPRGIFELKYFFTASIPSSGTGDSHSSASVQHRIRQMINEEAPEKVLSDDVIVGLLKQDGVDIARRTVAKYREAMNIASSVQRRREKRALARAGH
mgnify:FL=1